MFAILIIYFVPLIICVICMVVITLKIGSDRTGNVLMTIPILNILLAISYIREAFFLSEKELKKEYPN